MLMDFHVVAVSFPLYGWQFIW